MTPKQRHREEAAQLWGGTACILRTRDGHECRGRLQAHHVIESQRLTTLWNRAYTMERQGRSLPQHLRLLSEASLDDLIADGRNSAWCCEWGHRQIELGIYHLPHLPMAESFAADFDLQHELPEWADQEREEAA